MVLHNSLVSGAPNIYCFGNNPGIKLVWQNNPWAGLGEALRDPLVFPEATSFQGRAETTATIGTWLSPSPNTTSRKQLILSQMLQGNPRTWRRAKPRWGGKAAQCKKKSIRTLGQRAISRNRRIQPQNHRGQPFTRGVPSGAWRKSAFPPSHHQPSVTPTTEHVLTLAAQQSLSH